MGTPTKAKGDLAEMKVAADLASRGFKIAIPHGEDWDFDLIACKVEKLERIQVKYAESDGSTVVVRCGSHSLTNGKIRRTKRYTAAMVDWLAVYDKTTDRCFYVPASELGDGRATISLRLCPARNGQRRGIRFADEYAAPSVQRLPLPGAAADPTDPV